MAEPRGPMLLFGAGRDGGVEGLKSLDQVHTQWTKRTSVGERIVDVAGHLWVIDSCEDLGFAKPWSPFDLFRFRPRRIKLRAVDRGPLTQAEVLSMLAEYWRRPNIRELWSGIGLDDAMTRAANAPNVSKLVLMFYGRLKV